MSRKEPLFPDQNGYPDNKPSIKVLEGYQRLKAYRHVLDQLNEHSAQMSQMLRAMEDQEQGITTD